MPVASMTASVTVAKIKPRSFRPPRSAMLVPKKPCPWLLCYSVGVQNALARSLFRTNNRRQRDLFASTVISPRYKCGCEEREHQFTALIDPGVARLQDPPLGSR